MRRLVIFIKLEPNTSTSTDKIIEIESELAEFTKNFRKTMSDLIKI